MVSLDKAGKRLWVFPAPNGEYELDLGDGEGDVETVAAAPGPKAPIEGTLKMPAKSVPR